MSKKRNNNRSNNVNNVKNVNNAKKTVINDIEIEKVEADAELTELADIEAEAVAKEAPAEETAPADFNSFEENVLVLTDENGDELEFEIIAEYEKNGNRYFAMFPPEELTDEDSDIIEYVILKLEEDEDGNTSFVSVDDPDELDDVADYFDDRFSAEIDYDEN